MKLANAYVALIAAIIPAVWSLPTGESARQFKPSTCGAELCLSDTDGHFNGIPTSNLTSLCSQELPEVYRYVDTVQPCLDGDEGASVCTPGGIWQYKYLFNSECTRLGKNATFTQIQ